MRNSVSGGEASVVQPLVAKAENAFRFKRSNAILAKMNQ